MDDDVELKGLRERIYGLHSASATHEMIARLEALEERHRTESASTPAGAPEPRGTDAEAPGAGIPERSDAGQHPNATPPPEATAAGRPRRTLRWTMAAIGAVALVGFGIAIGANLTPPSVSADPASADPASARYPELTFPQTVEDVISADILRDSGIDPASTRYIATVSDFRIYLARPDDGDGRCIATFTSTDNRPWSAGCASGAKEGAAVFGVDKTLTVAIGDPVSPEVDGIPIRLSDSVTAYVAR